MNGLGRFLGQNAEVVRREAVDQVVFPAQEKRNLLFAVILNIEPHAGRVRQLHAGAVAPPVVRIAAQAHILAALIIGHSEWSRRNTAFAGTIGRLDSDLIEDIANPDDAFGEMDPHREFVRRIDNDFSRRKKILRDNGVRRRRQHTTKRPSDIRRGQRGAVGKAQSVAQLEDDQGALQARR